MTGQSETPQTPPDLFTDSLQRLQVLHDEQVAALAADNARLREEVEVLRNGVQPSSTLEAGEELRRLRNRAQSVALEAGRYDEARSPRIAEPAGPVEECTSLAASQVPLVDAQQDQTSSERPARRIATETSTNSPLKSFSVDLTRIVRRKRSGSTRAPTKDSVGGSSKQSGGSELLDEFSTYRRMREPSGCVAKLVSSPKFDALTGAVIVLNAVTIGLEASLTRAGQSVPLALQVSEYIFLSVYTLEVCLRLVAVGRRSLCNAWIVFDIVLVCCGFFDTITSNLGHYPTYLDNVMLARTLRLARLARVLRLMIKFHTLWMLIRGLVNSLLTLTWTCIIICMLLFIFAVLGLELLQPDPLASEQYNRIAEEKFGSLLSATVTLVQGMTLDSFAVVYRPVMIEKPLTIFYFVPFLLVVSIALMNLVTALMVNFSLEQAGKDKQAEELAQSQKKAEVIGILERAFGELDTGRSGRINLQEMLEAPEELRMLICQVADVGCSQQNVTNIFRALDFDHIGYLKIGEFCRGLLMLHDRKALESYFVVKRCHTVLRKLRFRLKNGDDARFGLSDVLSQAGSALSQVGSADSVPIL